MTNRVAITGMGCTTGLGNDLKSTWAALLDGRSGISKITSCDVSHLPVQIAGEVKNLAIDNDLLSPGEISRMDRFLHFSIHSASEALRMADLSELFSFYRPESMGSILGVGMGGFPLIERTYRTSLEKDFRRISPFFIPGIIPSMAAGIISLKFGLKGISYVISSACASATHAISAASQEIISGRHTVMVTGGSESTISSLPLGGFASMKALSRRNQDPEKASRPFDKERDGFVIGEGAGILILENLQKAVERNAVILGEIVGIGSSCDAFHITSPHPDGRGAIDCMKKALCSANIGSDQIGHINAHGTSTPLGDKLETKAIKEIFGKHAYNIAITASKSMTGHLLGAAGGIEAIFTALALKEEIIPPTINLENSDLECDLNYTPYRSKKLKCEYALSNSFGFGGTNASIILKKYTGD